MPVTKQCMACGKDITRPASHMRGNVYCNRECASRKKSEYLNIPKNKVCLTCGKTFDKLPRETWEYFETKKYCKHECYSESLIGKNQPNTSERFKKMWSTDEKFIQKMMNRPRHSEETRRKISASQIGKKLSDDHRKKLSEAFSGEKHPMYGKKMPEASIRKMANSKRGRPLTEDHKKLLSTLLKGRKLSKETREKLSEITKRKWQDPIFVQNILSGLAKAEVFGSRLEDKVAEYLQRLGIRFLRNQYIPGTRCIVDFLIPDINGIIEADGDYWHNKPGKKDKDARRDRMLKKMGYSVLRLSESTIHQDPTDAILQFYNELQAGL